MSETREECTKKSYEPCRLHPVDCPNCAKGDTCQQREITQAHPDKIKSCRQFWPKGQTHL